MEQTQYIMVKHLESTKLRVEMEQILLKQINELSKACEKNMDLSDILKEKKKALKFLSSEKEFIFSFEHGGWNTVDAKDYEEAYNIAKEKFNKPAKEYRQDILDEDGSVIEVKGLIKAIIVVKKSINLNKPKYQQYFNK